MKITGNVDLPAIPSSKALNPTLESDLVHTTKPYKPVRRKGGHFGHSGAGVRLKRDGAPAGRRSRPDTPLLQWKFNDGAKGKDSSLKEGRPPPEFGRRNGQKVVSARKLGAVLWRLQLPEVADNAAPGGDRSNLPKKDLLGFEYGASHIGLKFHGRYNSKECNAEVEDLMRSPGSVSGPRNECLTGFEPSFLFPNPAMEGATKWDPICLNMSDEVEQIYGRSTQPDGRVSALELELEQARVRIQELETERQSSKKKLEHFLKKLSEERATWRSREHDKVRSIIDDIKGDLNRERKNRQRLEIVNSKLVKELGDAKLSAKRYLQDYEKERNARVLIEEVCDELAKEIGEDKAEAEALKRESLKLREEVDDERKMLQMAEVWREERVQMKLIDAKVMLEEKYSHMNKLVKDLESFLSSTSTIPDSDEVRIAEILHQTAASLSIQEIRDLSYEPPNPDDIFSVFDDVNSGEPNNREIDDRSNPVNVFTKDNIQRLTNEYFDNNGDIEEDGSEWESVSHLEEGEDSSCSPIGNDTECEDNECGETPVTEVSEGSAISKTHLKKVTSIARLWKSYPKNGENFKIISLDGMKGRLSHGASFSPDRGSDKGRYSHSDLIGQCSSPESKSSHAARGRKGCIGMQMGSLKAKLLEARMESQKIQLKQVLKQKI